MQSSQNSKNNGGGQGANLEDIQTDFKSFYNATVIKKLQNTKQGKCQSISNMNMQKYFIPKLTQEGSQTYL